jgi:hypothetical protein
MVHLSKTASVYSISPFCKKNDGKIRPPGRRDGEGQTMEGGDKEAAGVTLPSSCQ